MEETETFYQSRDEPHVPNTGRLKASQRRHLRNRGHCWTEQSLFDQLPDELILFLIRFLDSKDVLFVFSCVCRRLRRLARDGPHWRKVYLNRWGAFEDVLRPCATAGSDAARRSGRAAPWPMGDWRTEYLVRHRFETVWTNLDRLHKTDWSQPTPGNAGPKSNSASNLLSSSPGSLGAALPGAQGLGSLSGVTALDIGGMLMVSGGQDTFVRLWDLQSGQRLRALKGHSNCVTDVIVTEEGILSSSRDGSIRFWDLDTLQTKQTLRTHTSGVNKMAMRTTRNGQTCVLSAGQDGSTHLVRIATGDVLQIYRTSDEETQDGSDAVTAIACSPSFIPTFPYGHHNAAQLQSFATGDALGVCVWWDAERSASLHTWLPHQELGLNDTAPVCSLLFDETSPDLVFTAGASCTQMWDRRCNLNENIPVCRWGIPGLSSAKAAVLRNTLILGRSDGALLYFDRRKNAADPIWTRKHGHLSPSSKLAASQPYSYTSSPPNSPQQNDITALCLRPERLAVATAAGSLYTLDGPAVRPDIACLSPQKGSASAAASSSAPASRSGAAQSSSSGVAAPSTPPTKKNSSRSKPNKKAETPSAPRNRVGSGR